MEQNPLASHIGKDLTKVIGKVEVIQGTAKDSGNIYYAIETTLVNGFKFRTFLRGAELFAWSNALDQMQTQQIVDQNF